MFKKTKEKIKQNEYVVFIKKIWDNKRYRSLLILALYFIFFFIIITGLRSSYQENQNMDNNESNNNYFSFENLKEEYNNLRDYSYEIFVNEGSLIKGKIENGVNNFEYMNEQYTIINDNIYKEEEENLKKIELTEEDIILTIVDKVMLNNLVDYVSSLNKSGVINEDSFALDFEVPNSYFLLEEDQFVKISIVGSTITKVDEIIVDLTEYKKESYVIKVKVSDING